MLRTAEAPAGGHSGGKNAGEPMEMNASGAPSEAVGRAGKLLGGSRSVVVFTGAGISTESGIPDFRSPGGVWSRHRPVTYQEFVSSREARAAYWKMKREGWNEFAASAPNPAHLAIVQIERAGRLTGLITQNIDGLHLAAGNSEEKIVELHGNNRYVKCLTCGAVTGMEEAIRRIDGGEEAPECLECGGLLKPATVSFGQEMPRGEMERAHEYSTECDLFTVVGSSLVVQPAASFPVIAKRSGAKLIFINMTPTPLDAIADVIIRGTAGAALPAVVAAAGLKTRVQGIEGEERAGRQLKME
ncbi:MAG: Sir2 family NAD-dependent protein deacetylase [bacterium]